MTTEFLSNFFGKKTKPVRKRNIVDEKSNVFPKPKGSVEYNDYYFIDIKKSKDPEKKYDAIFKHKKSGKDKIIPFGNKKIKDFTEHRDVGLKTIYDSKNKKPHTNLMSVSALNKYILWNKNSIESSVRDYKKYLKGIKL